MDNIDDSGIEDGDQRLQASVTNILKAECQARERLLDKRSRSTAGHKNEGNDNTISTSVKSGSYSALKKTSELQKKIERQRDHARRSANVTVDQQPKKSNFLSRSRLTVPSANNRITQKDTEGYSPDQQPLVTIVSDESEEDEFDVLRIPRAAQKEIKDQLMKDGYNLDLEPDDEDLDLIPPRPLNERCSCCNVHIGCRIQ